MELQQNILESSNINLCSLLCLHVEDTRLHPTQYLKRFSEIYAVLMIQNYSINVTVSLHVVTTRWCHCRIDFPLIHVVIIDQNPPDPTAQHYPKLNDNAIALST